MAKVKATREALVHLLILSLVSFFLITISIKEKYSSNFIQVAVMSAMAPAQELTAKSIQLIRRGASFYFDLVAVRKKNEALKENLNTLKAEAARLAELKIENLRLRKMLAFKENSSLKLVAAQVVGVDATSWSRGIIIDRGSADGLSGDMSVITPDGLVGRLTDVSRGYSKVMLITDVRSSVDSIVQRSRSGGVVVGMRGNAGIMKYLPLNADVAPGDLVISSGMGGIFPKGLVVGKVSQVKNIEQGLFKEADIEPEAELSKIEEVFVILK